MLATVRVQVAHDLGDLQDLAALDLVLVVLEPLVVEERISKYGWCAGPGSVRSLSTKNGLSVLEAAEADIVLIHDGSRCLLTPDLIERTVAAARGGAEGVIPALPVTDTIKEVEGGAVRRTLDRSNLWAVQTPQAFRYGALRRAFSRSEEDLRSATDDASLIESLGGRVEIVEGERTNIKLTSPDDLIFA